MSLPMIERTNMRDWIAAMPTTPVTMYVLFFCTTPSIRSFSQIVRSGKDNRDNGSSNAAADRQGSVRTDVLTRSLSARQVSRNDVHLFGRSARRRRAGRGKTLGL